MVWHRPQCSGGGLRCALRWGACLIFLLPPLADWPQYSDPDYQRLLVHPYTLAQLSRRFIALMQGSLMAAENALLIEQGLDPRWLNPVAERNILPAATRKSEWQACLSEDQFSGG